MSDNTTVRVCEACRRIVRDEDADIVKAVELVRADTFDSSGVVEGNGVLFHRSCAPFGSDSYRFLDE